MAVFIAAVGWVGVLEVRTLAGWIALAVAAAAGVTVAFVQRAPTPRPPGQAPVDEAVEKLAAQNAELSTLLWKTVDRMQVLSSIDQDFTERTLDLDGLLQTFASRTAEAVGAIVGVYLVEEHQPALRGFEARDEARAAALRPVFEAEPHYELPTLARLALRTGTTRAYEDVHQIACNLGSPQEAELFSRHPSLKHALAVPIRSREGDAVGALLLIREKSQSAFSQDDIELSEQVADRAAIAIDNARLYRVRETFLGLAAHELRTPTTALRAQAQLMLRRLDTLPIERVRTGLENIERQTGRLTRLINDLLDVTRIEAAKLELRQERIDGGVLASELVERFEQVTGRKCFRREGDRHAWVQVDPVRLDQVLSNLLTNAVKFCQDGDIVVRVEQRDGSAVFSVIDHGAGITREKQGLLFERFSQLGNDGDRRGGLGLGLYLSRELVMRMGGRIWIDSDGIPGHPTAFNVSFPALVTDTKGAARSNGPNVLAGSAAVGALGSAAAQPEAPKSPELTAAAACTSRPS